MQLIMAAQCLRLVFGLTNLRALYPTATLMHTVRPQAVGPVAITSLLLSNGVGGLVPAADVNIDPNNPVDPAAQHLYNTVCIQVRDWMATLSCLPEGRSPDRR